MQLVLFAHGSRDPRWREPFEALRDRVAERVGVDRVRLAYLEYASPSLEEAVAEAVAAGARRIGVLPVFMAGGGHVARDIPVHAERVRERFPDVDVEVLPPVGETAAVVDAMVAVAAAAFDGE